MSGMLFTSRSVCCIVVLYRWQSVVISTGNVHPVDSSVITDSPNDVEVNIKLTHIVSNVNVIAESCISFIKN